MLDTPYVLAQYQAGISGVSLFVVFTRCYVDGKCSGGEKKGCIYVALRVRYAGIAQC